MSSSKKPKPIRYYMDEACQNSYPLNEQGEAIIDWGVMSPGQEKTKTLYAKNESRDRISLRQPYTLDEALSITDFPTNLTHNQVGAVTLRLAPSKERIDAIRAGWGFDVLIG